MNLSENELLMKNMALALIYLSSWQEKEFATIHRAWKGYDYTILDRLKEEDLIDFSYKAKSLDLTEEGVEQAKLLIEKFKQLQ